MGKEEENWGRIEREKRGIGREIERLRERKTERERESASERERERESYGETNKGDVLGSLISLKKLQRKFSSVRTIFHYPLKVYGFN